MELTTTAAIAHKIIKAQRAKGTLQLRNTPLPPSNSLDRLIDEIHAAYKNRSGKSHGAFEADEQNYPTAANLRKHFQDQSADFVATSHALMQTLLTKANEASSNLATGGSVLMAHVTSGGSQWFIVTILTDKVSAAIDNNLNLVDSVHLDLNSMRFAGRVDITRWLDNEDRYVSFLQGASKDVSDYFLRFLGCTHPQAIRKETTRLVDVVRSAVNRLDATEDQREAARSLIYQYLNDCAKNAEPLNIDSLCNRAWPDNPDALREPLIDPDSGISDGFVPHKTALKGLVRFEGKGPHWHMKFEREAVTEGNIQLNADAKEITIKNVPDEVIARFQNDFPEP
ncbi:nucleoid-associated protein [Salinisphaera sp. P385]|uniref:Nucleoid-associated protein n=1 Tax=Spectribacter acetivorans TaxID=3075603 RepID=A0ABU3BBG0_9GAMM|nr:nucleoid-associated protein [Salinisphaera sp. P385]MDT0618316.1 nucleoid-associated protein [Salinisphaera sp. P385]